jgi:parvulin-like peptidyl-prolyl isomerase
MTRINIRFVVVAIICYMSLPLNCAFAQKAADSKPEIAAFVGDEPIYSAEVNRLLTKAARGRDINPDVLPSIQAQMLREVIDRRLVLAYACRANSAPTSEEVEKELNKLRTGQASRQQFLYESPKIQSGGEADLRRQITWNLVWHKLVAQHISESRLDSYFRAHHRDFDGTTVSVSHILLRPEKNAAPGAWDDLTARAVAIRAEIKSEKISFAEAARKYSAGPSAADGGALGFIPRHDVMDEAFSHAAFALEVGELSEPVRTPFGIHIIRCSEIKPGDKQLNDVRIELEECLSRELLAKLAKEQETFTPVKYTGKLPYFKAATRELVKP